MKNVSDIYKHNHTKPTAFGLPKGSIRAALAVLVIATACTCVVLKVDVPDWFIGFGSTTITFYFMMDRKR